MNYKDATSRLVAAGFHVMKIGYGLKVTIRGHTKIIAIVPTTGEVDDDHVLSLLPSPSKPDFIASLTPGTRVRHVSGTKAWIVTQNFGDRATAVQTVDITNTREWEIVP